MEQKKNWSEIKCPDCGATFHPAEIYMPGDLIGDPKSHGIIKDALNHIIYIDYKEDGEPLLIQEYECPHCGKRFIVEATVSYKTKKVDEEKDFSTLETSLL